MHNTNIFCWKNDNNIFEIKNNNQKCNSMWDFVLIYNEFLCELDFQRLKIFKNDVAKFFLIRQYWSKLILI